MHFENDHPEMSKAVGVTGSVELKGDSGSTCSGQRFILLSHPTILIHKPSEPISLSL